MSIDAMKQALHTLEGWANHGEWVWPESALEQAKRNTTESITALRAAIEQAHDWDEVEALQASLREHMVEIHRLRAAIEQAQEPVAWVGPSWLNPETRTWESESFAPRPINGWIPLYTAPRQWQGLTGDEVNEFAAGCHLGNSVQGAIRKAEAKLKEKNT